MQCKLFLPCTINFIILFSLISLLSAQAPDTLWTKIYGSPDWGSRGKVVRQTSDGGFIIGGETKLNRVPDIYLVRTGSAGDTLWTKMYGGEDNEKCNAIHVTEDNGFLVAGCTYRSASKWDIYLLRLDANGDTLWTKTCGGYDDDDAISIMPSQNGYVIAGKTRPSQTEDFDIYIVTIDTAGEVQSTKTYGGDNDDVAASAEKTSDGGCIITGTSFSPDYKKREIFLVRTDPNADTLWTKNYSEGAYNLEGNSVKQLGDGGFIITGSLDIDTSDVFDLVIYVLRVDQAGEPVWSETYPVTVGRSGNVGNSISLVGGSGYIIAGYRDAGMNHRDLYIMRINLTGDTLWTRTYGNYNLESANCIEPTEYGGFIVTGYTTLIGDQYSKVYLLRLDKEATVIKKPYNNPQFVNSNFQNVKRIEIYDLMGRNVKTVSPNAFKNWKGISGIYMVRFIGDGFINKKIMYVK